MENKSWFIHIELITIFIAILGGFYSMDSKIERQSARIDTVMEQTTQRTDKLYEMFITLIKEGQAQRKDLYGK